MLTQFSVSFRALMKYLVVAVRLFPYNSKLLLLRYALFFLHFVMLLISTKGEDVLFGDYGEIIWTNEEDEVVARAGGGGYGDFTDGEERSTRRIMAVYPNTPVDTYTSENDQLSQSDEIFGNGARDIILGCGGEEGA